MAIARISLGFREQSLDGPNQLDSLEELYRIYSSDVLSFCRRRLDDAAEAEDACHETILKAYVARHSFREGEPMWPWLATIAANVCMDIKRARSRLVDDPDLELCGKLECSAEHLPEEQLVRKLRVQIVSEALETLPSHYRSHIHLRDFEGWTYEDIGRFFGTSMASVKSTLLRARCLLKKRVQKVAKARGQWPLPAIAPLGFPRLKASLQRWAITVRHSTWMTDQRIAPTRIFEALGSAAPAVSSAAAAAVIAVGVVGTLGIATPRVDARGSAESAEATASQAATAGGLSERSGQAANPAMAEAAETPDADELEASSDPNSEAEAGINAESESASTFSSSTDSTSTSSNSPSGTTSQTVQTGSDGSSGSSIEVSIAPASTGGSSDSSVETPQPTGTVDPDSSDDHSGVEAEPGPANINCEDPGLVTGTVCTVSETTEEILPAATLP